MKKSKKLLIIILVIIVAIPILATVKYYAIGPRYIGNTALFEESVIYYKGSNYHYAGYGSNIKSGKRIKNGLFENMYLSQNGDDYIIVSQIHERFAFIREDLIKKYKLCNSDNKIIRYDGYILVNDEKYNLIDEGEIGEFSYEYYRDIGVVQIPSYTLQAFICKNDFDCNYIILNDSLLLKQYVYSNISGSNPYRIGNREPNPKAR